MTMPIGRAFTVALVLGAPLAPADAAGGAHIIDDADVEAAGHCHLESWYAFHPHGSRDFVLGPACTPAALPSVELDGFLIRSHGEGSSTAVGLAAKTNLRATETGLGIALTPSLAFETHTGRVASAGLVMPMGLPITKAFALNADVGATWTRGEPLRAFAGIQAMVKLAASLQVMAETFVRGGLHAGQQAGLRWTADRGRIDIDLLAGRYLDGTTRRTLALGMTIRR
jgi:hypothetical protein